MVRLEFEVRGFPEMLQAISVMEKATQQKVEAVLDEGAAIILNRIRERFLKEIDVDSNPWVPSAAGLARRAKGGTGTLFDSGDLWRSIQLHSSTPGERTIGAGVPYAKKIQEGGWHAYDNPKLPLQPPRTFIGASADDVSMMQKLFAKRLNLGEV
jgi:hypothetical protein